MRASPLLTVGVLAVSILAGCFNQEATPPPGTRPPPPPPPGPEFVDGLLHATVTTSQGALESYAASGAISHLVAPAAGTLVLPANVFAVQERRFLAEKTFTLNPGAAFEFLVPPGATSLTLTWQGTNVTIPTPDTGKQLVSGENVLAWFKVLRDGYLGRCTTCPNYARAQEYFAQLFAGFGVAEVERDPYGDLALGNQLANVVGYRYPKLDATHPLWLGVGGHYDLVREAPEGAFDNTAGTLLTLELARVFAQLETQHNLVFGLWGGEESGLMGSQFFTRTNPNIAAQMKVYVNLDVSAFSWPGPAPVSQDGSPPDCSTPISAREGDYCPDPLGVMAGPDGPVADGLLAWARTIQQDVVVDYPDPYFTYTWQSDLLRFGAASDHVAFIAAGVPSYMYYHAALFDNPIGFHNQVDTIDNWTKYMALNVPVDVSEPLEPDELALGEGLVVQSVETYLWLVFYNLLYHDLGLFGPAPVAPPAPA